MNNNWWICYASPVAVSNSIGDLGWDITACPKPPAVYELMWCE